MSQKNFTIDSQAMFVEDQPVDIIWSDEELNSDTEDGDVSIYSEDESMDGMKVLTQNDPPMKKQGLKRKKMMDEKKALLERLKREVKIIFFSIISIPLYLYVILISRNQLLNLLLMICGNNRWKRRKERKISENA